MIPVIDLQAARSESGSARVEVIQDLCGLAALRPQWTELLLSSPAPSPFLTWEWLGTWWKHMHGAASLNALAVWLDGRLAAVAPLMAPRAPRWFPRLEFLGTGHAGSDYLDVIVRPDDQRQALDAIAAYVSARQWTIRLDHVAASSAALSLAEHVGREGWTSCVAPDGVCPVIDLEGHTWDSYLGSRGPAHRANVRRRMRTAEKQVHLSFEQVSTETERRNALAALVAFHDQRFGRRGGSTAFLGAPLRAFHDEATGRMLERGWLRMYVLRMNGDPAAVMYGFAFGGRFYFYQHGFDVRHERSSAGLVLMARSVRAALEEGMRSFDMLWGAEPYKWLWATGAHALHRVHLFPSTVSGRLHRCAVDARRHLVPVVRRAWNLGGRRAT